MTPVIITAEIAGALIVLAVLGLTAAAHEWIGFSVSVSLRFIPASKRRPKDEHAAAIQVTAPEAQPDGIGAVVRKVV